MNRKIKFRVYDKVNCEYVVGAKLLELPNREIDIHNITLTNCDIYKFEQYTGLKDKNGVEIYENDSVEVHNVFPNNKEEKFKGVIVYENGAYLVRLDKFDSPIRNQYDDDIVHYIGYIEVIGNIHE